MADVWQERRGCGAEDTNKEHPSTDECVIGHVTLSWNWLTGHATTLRPAGECIDLDQSEMAGPAGRKATASISILAFSSRPATCTAVLVGGSFGKSSPRMRENTA